MSQQYDTIVLSPHLDDAALSCGGLIHTLTSAGKAVLIVTFMAGIPPKKPFSQFAKKMHDRWELALEIVQNRRQEDINACHTLGAHYLHCAELDAIYRDNPKTGAYFYTSNETLFGPYDAQDAHMIVPKLEDIIRNLPPHKKLIVPLTVGNHVDHQLVRTAAESCYTDPIIYYEDYPYARGAGAVETVIANDRLKLEYEIVSLGEKALKIKGESIAEFQSQVSTFFNGRIDIDTQISAYATKVGGERYWMQKR